MATKKKSTKKAKPKSGKKPSVKKSSKRVATKKKVTKKKITKKPVAKKKVVKKTSTIKAAVKKSPAKKSVSSKPAPKAVKKEKSRMVIASSHMDSMDMTPVSADHLDHHDMDMPIDEDMKDLKGFDDEAPPVADLDDDDDF